MLCPLSCGNDTILAQNSHAQGCSSNNSHPSKFKSRKFDCQIILLDSTLVTKYSKQVFQVFFKKKKKKSIPLQGFGDISSRNSYYNVCQDCNGDTPKQNKTIISCILDSVHLNPNCVPIAFCPDWVHNSHFVR